VQRPIASQAAQLEPSRSSDVYFQSSVVMGTCVTIQVVGRGSDRAGTLERQETVDRALAWFHQIEECCTRFDSRSELMQLTTRIGAPVPVSPLLFEAIQFALAVAEDTNGAFDPTIGSLMEARGFNREHRTGQIVHTGIEPGRKVSYRDVELDPVANTVLLRQPLVLDLGAVAKGLAIDLAARELRPLEHFAINAGGDLFVAGNNPDDELWSIGIRHPRRDGEFFESFRTTNQAVCTSGDYERRGADDDAVHHILDPRTGASAHATASVTVVAPTAIVADALATAAFVLGPDEGLRMLERQGVDGLVISTSLERFATPGVFATDRPH